MQQTLEYPKKYSMLIFLLLKFNLNWQALFERMKSLTITHEFGIIENFNKQYVYNHYTPDIYDCIPVNDDFIQELIKPLAMMKTYFQHLNDRLKV
ncbi:Uncharacterised protein [Niallia circulans]|nr:Uncharacterised protein [Niallia circulans]